VPQAFTPDAKMLLFGSAPASTVLSLSVLALDGSRTVTTLLKDAGFNQQNAVLSPDGR
jgi:hypothetical protein